MYGVSYNLIYKISFDNLPVFDATSYNVFSFLKPKFVKYCETEVINIFHKLTKIVDSIFCWVNF